MGKSISLKGTNEGYLLILNDQFSLEEIYEDLKTLFNKMKKEEKYKNKVELTIHTECRLLSDKEKEKLTNLINERTNFLIKEFKEEVVKIKTAEKWYEETAPKIYVKNIRNGQIIDTKRDVILFGDVKPGGIVRSSGSIVIIGDIQGLVHAGSEGAEEAIIVAPFSFDGQVRISEHVEIIDTTETDSDTSDSLEYQIVYLNDLHTIEFTTVKKLAQIRPKFANDIGGLIEWQKRL